MRQHWSDLLFLHWEVPAEIIEATLPPGLEVDTFAGKAYLGLVPFTMSGVRPIGFPSIPWISNFHEVNVRTYVHFAGRDPGVWFYSLDAANPVAVWLAQTTFHLPYKWARMSMQYQQATGGVIDYSSSRRNSKTGASCRIRYLPTGSPTHAVPGTLSFFLLERYLLYAFGRGQLHQVRVHHRSYPVQEAELLDCQEDLLASAGFERPDHPPLIHYASGVDVEVFPLRSVDQSSW
ncbi:YqjF family protein [Tautonia rosea]|uniref:YqjF family protein n=1 Tax=Tautonia rosea TaxID=2728037 RepID=UPI001475FF4F|nr:DUF2071 domain-containing protein [Tautonia rosea]